MRRRILNNRFLLLISLALVGGMLILVSIDIKRWQAVQDETKPAENCFRGAQWESIKLTPATWWGKVDKGAPFGEVSGHPFPGAKYSGTYRADKDIATSSLVDCLRRVAYTIDEPTNYLSGNGPNGRHWSFTGSSTSFKIEGSIEPKNGVSDIRVNFTMRSQLENGPLLPQL